MPTVDVATNNEHFIFGRERRQESWASAPVVGTVHGYEAALSGRRLSSPHQCVEVRSRPTAPVLGIPIRIRRTPHPIGQD
jgi:hypothetical protein